MKEKYPSLFYVCFVLISGFGFSRVIIPIINTLKLGDLDV
jgi:hypothetical protein